MCNGIWTVEATHQDFYLQVAVSVDILAITDIKETSMNWGCKLQLNMTWLDQRLRWRELKEQEQVWAKLKLLVKINLYRYYQST